MRGESPDIVLSLLEPVILGGRLISELGSESMLVPQVEAALILVEELDRAEAFIQEIFEDARRRGSLFGFLVGLGMRAWLHERRGDLAAAEADVRAVLDQVPKEQSAMAVPATLHYCQGTVLERPSLDDVSALAEKIELPPPFVRTATGAFFLEARGTFRLARGEIASGKDDLRQAGEIYRALRIGPMWAAWRSKLALAMREEEHRRAAELAQEELQLAREADSPRAEGVALRTLGLLHGHDQGTDLLQQSLTILNEAPATYERARTLAELGAALRRGNQRSEAQQRLRSALDLAHRCGAERL
jgi:tetratricopeptide (TPR) repeat protein